MFGNIVTAVYAAVHREIATKGKDSRFKKTEPGKFAATKHATTTEEPAPAKPKTAKGAKKKEPTAAEAEPGAAPAA